MSAALTIEKHPQIFDLDYLQQEVCIGWTEEDFEILHEQLSPYVQAIKEFLISGQDFPTHIENSGSIAIPIGETTTPEELFATLGDDVLYSMREYRDFWITVHYPNPEPVVTLLPKRLPGVPDKLKELCERCGAGIGTSVGGSGGMFLAWLLPGFSWAMHTDHDNLYEQIATRIHLPLITTPQSLYVWGRKQPDGVEQWLVTSHLEKHKIYHVRVDVPHTVVNQHETESRLHLILDVHEEPHI